MSLLIRGALLEGESVDVAIRNGLIESVGPTPVTSGESAPEALFDRELDGRGLHLFPSFRNAHTHVAMVLFRGYGDDMPLMEWLQTRIWPAEKVMTAEDVYHGARLGLLEMIRGGTTFLNEMYWHRPALLRAVEEMGVRACLGATILDLGDDALLSSQKAEIEELVAARAAGGLEAGGRVELSIAPHAIYTVSPAVLEWVARISDDAGVRVHIHLSETEGEVQGCLDEHGCRPAELLERVGLVSPRLVAAHGQFLDRSELELLARGGATLVTNPTANLKLATGGIFPWREARAAGVRVCLGTDGAGSNNNLDMIEEMKVAALVQKHREVDATALPAQEALAMATRAGAEAFGQGSGTIAAGEPADLVLVDFSDPATQPLHDPDSALVYAANASQVHTTICAGRVLMHGRRVEVCDEKEVVAGAVAAIREVLERSGAS